MHFLASLLRARLRATAFVGFLILLLPFAARAQGNNQQIPILQVLQNVQSPLASGAELVFADATVGSATGSTLTLIVRNQGNAVLANLAVALSGEDADNFTADLSGTSLVPGSNDPITLTLTFRPTASGIRDATLSLTSNDIARSPFLLELSGTGLLPPGAPTNVITFPALASRPYGSEAFDLPATASSGLPVSYRVKGPATLGGAGRNKLIITGAGTITVSATQRGGVLNGVTYPSARAVKQTLVVTKVPLTLTVAPARKLRGVALPAPVITYEGFVAGDTSAKLATPPVRSTPATAKSLAGSYPLTLTGGTDPNYTFTVVPSTLQVFDYSGVYEALLLAPDASARPVAKLQINVTTGHLFSGKLADGAESALFSFKDPKNAANSLKLDLDSDDALATTTIAVRPAGRPAFSYTLAFRFSATQPAASALAVTLTNGPTLLGKADDGRLVFTKNKTYTAQALTLVLAPPASLAPDAPDPLPLPVGYGYATGNFSLTGILTLDGRLADGKAFTASLSPDSLGRYRLFALPYEKLPQSYLAGRIQPIAHPDLPAGYRHVPADPEQPLLWAKSANTKERAFRAGFGADPLEVAFTLDPWLPPSKLEPNATLAQRLALPVGGAFLPRIPDPDFALAGGNPRRFPTAFQLGATNRVVVTAPLAGPPAKSTLKLSVKTGAFIGSLALSDLVGGRTIKRTLRIEGVLRQPPSTEEPGPVFGAGHFSLPPLVKGDEFRLGEYRLERPPVVGNQ
ncbi:MAG: hypothetical protein H7067_13470 [Burkholderiales bacterium]|nr:hypothetical protein [Opitutaceae bacterium]